MKTLAKAQEMQWYKEAESSYNAMAKVWNALPGSKLLWPKEKFEIRYCYHTKSERELHRFSDLKIPTCIHCGYPPKGSYDSTS